MSITSIRRALYGRLAGDTTLTGLLATPATGYAQSIYFQIAPQGAQTPYVIFSKQSGVPTEAFTDPSAFENDVWLIKAIDHATTADPAEAVAARVVTLLNDANLTISGAVTLYLRRSSDVQYPEVTDGETYQHVGSLFRLTTD